MTIKPRTHIVEIHEFNDDFVQILCRLKAIPDTVDARRPLRAPSKIRNVTWSAYQSFLRAIVRKGLRHSYRQGTLELMSPRTFWRESRKSLVRRFAQHLSSELLVELTSLGRVPLLSPTLGIGLEPDEAFAVAKGRGRRVKPNLVIEVVDGGPESKKVAVEERIVSRMRILREIGLSEVWLVQDESVTICANQQNHCWKGKLVSQLFPHVTSALLSKHLARSRCSGEHDAIRGLLYDVTHEIGTTP